MVRKIESKLTVQEYKILHSSDFCPGKFYGRAKLHKIDLKGLVDDLTARAIISNINTHQLIIFQNTWQSYWYP